MTNNEIIEKLVHWSGDYDKLSFGDSFPDYPNDDAAAMSLLDTLMEKGYCVDLKFTGATVYLWTCEVYKNSKSIVWICRRNTRREAVCAACLEVARKEDV